MHRYRPGSGTTVYVHDHFRPNLMRNEKNLLPPLLPLFFALAAIALPASAATPTSTLDQVRERGALRCGVVATPEDWNKTDLHGPLAGLYTEICKAVSVTALGAKARVELKAYATELEAKEGVSRRDVDLVVGVSPDASSMWQWKIAFGPPVFYDAQGFLVRKDAHATSLASLAGLRVCTIADTDNDRILAARAQTVGLAIRPRVWEEESEMDDALSVRRCDAVSAYLSRLAQVQRDYPRTSQDTILADTLTLSPAAPAYRNDDGQWGMLVDWTIYALFQAEASGVSQANAMSQATSGDPVVQRLVGVDWAASRALGLEAHDWAVQVIAVVGNYGEIFDRTVGAHGMLKMPRGLNALWLNGGLIHPLPVK
jgi:general L-amino acid transport system substrate-binding protein